MVYCTSCNNDRITYAHVFIFCLFQVAFLPKEQHLLQIPSFCCARIVRILAHARRVPLFLRGRWWWSSHPLWFALNAAVVLMDPYEMHSNAQELIWQPRLIMLAHLPTGAYDPIKIQKKCVKNRQN